MTAYEIIDKKRKGGELSEEEIIWLCNGYLKGDVPDYQMSAWLMAICLLGMSDKETACLTRAIANSGDKICEELFGPFSVDKHSTGGVGDKTTLIVAPIAAALGCTVAKMSGRGLGHTGGTVDKLLSFTGYNISLTRNDFISQAKKIGVAVVGQSENLAPLDKKLYALRDATATVNSIPLIASSIMGKKLALGARSIVLDVKCGSGAFLKTEKEARLLAKAMCELGRSCGRRVKALITNMDVPLGFCIGNILEVKEAMSVLKGEGPADLTEICIEIASSMVSLAFEIEIDESRERVKNVLSRGTAYEKFKEWILAQGGDVSYLDNPSLFKEAKYKLEVFAEADGFIQKMNTEKIGAAAVLLGAGRAKKEDGIDLASGIILAKKTAEPVRRGELIATLYTEKEHTLKEAKERFLSALKIGDEAPNASKLIYEII